MGYFVIKNKFGIKPYKDTDGRAEYNADGYFMDIDEYHQMKDEIWQKENALFAAQKEADQRVSEVWEGWQKEKKNWEQKYRKELAASERRIEQRYKPEITELNDALQKNTALYNNFLRIQRERANASRGIVPKKQHHGYIILWTREVMEPGVGKAVYNPEWGMKVRDGVIAWVTRVQTPFAISYPCHFIKPQILKELVEKKVLAELGISVLNEVPRIAGYCKTVEEYGEEKNALYRWRFRANVTVGLWEIDLYTIKEPLISENMLPPDSQYKNKEKLE